jgi:hypothetical protein
VLQLATAIDADWSDLPLRPFYVPLMQQLITTLAVQIQPPRNVQAGAPLVAMFASIEPQTAEPQTTKPQTTEEATRQGAPAEQLPTVTLADPLGTRSLLSTRLQGRWLLAESTAAGRPGVYTVSLPDGRPQHFAVQTDSAESDLTQLDATRQRQAVEQLGGQLLTSLQEHLESDRRRRHGQEIWPLLLAALLGLMALEVILQQRFAGVLR